MHSIDRQILRIALPSIITNITVPLLGLIDLVNQAGATLVGAACAIEKGFQGGGDALRAAGIRVESLAIIESMSDEEITFRL